MIVRVLNTVDAWGRSIPNETSSELSPLASSSPRNSPMIEASVPITNASSITEREHLAAGRAERAQRRQLARALGDRDRQGVGDHEAPDEQRDPAEREQEVLEDVEEAAGVLGRLLRLPLTGPHLRARPEQRLDLVHDLLGRVAVLGGDADLVVLARLVEDPLSLGQCEDRHRRAAERGDAADLDRSDDPEPLHRPARDDPDLVADLEVVLARRRRVDVDLVRAGREVPLVSVSGLKRWPAGE